MDERTQQRLLQLNREFYATVAEPFNETRQGWTPGKRRLLRYVPAAGGTQISVADIGCGNGRFALMLDSLDAAFRYVGVDGNPALLALAAARTRTLEHGTATFVEADLADSGWRTAAGMDASCDLVVCLATLQHMPGHALRQRLLCDLAALLVPGGRLAVSAWQFLGSERFRRRLIPWTTIGLTEDDVEPGDGLLPWKQERYAVRYVHQIDEAELARLVAAAGLTLLETYRADGKEADLNLYAILTKRVGS